MTYFSSFQFPQELYLHALYVIHRLLSYQKRSRVRVPYPWKDLWTSLISLLKFLTSNETALVKKMNVFAVALQVTVIFNLFITYGDTFLPSPSSYDELYYELVRCHTTFDSLYSMALRYSTSGGEHKVRILKVEKTKKYPLRRYILGVLTQQLGTDAGEVMKH